MRTVRAAARWPAREERFERGWDGLIAVRALLDALAQERLLPSQPADATVADALRQVREAAGADVVALFSRRDERAAADDADGDTQVLRCLVTAQGPVAVAADLAVAPGHSLATAAATAAGVAARVAVELSLAAADGDEQPPGWLVALYGADDADTRAAAATAMLEQFAWPFALAVRGGWQAVGDAGRAGGAWPGLQDAERTQCRIAWEGVVRDPDATGAESDAGGEPHGGAVPVAPTLSPERRRADETATRALDENVQFTVYRPRRIAPQVWSTVLAFAHLAERRADAPPDEPDPVEEVQRQARQVLGDQASTFAATTEDSGDAIPRDGELTFVLTLPGMEVNPPRRSFRWVEDVHREEFRIRAPAALDGRTVRGGLQVFLGALLVADVALALRVDATTAHTAPTDTEADRGRPYRRIFPSYSHRDEAIVRQVEAYARTMGDEFLRDVTHLRAGEVWDARLRDFIRDADVFQLFWSRNSMGSPYVRQEWEYALSLARPHFVRPTYWETPLPEAPEHDLPPPTLRALHFQRLPVQAEASEPPVPPAAPAAPPPATQPPSRIKPVRPPRVHIEYDVATGTPTPPPAPATERPPPPRARRWRFPTALAALLLVGFLGGSMMLRQGALGPPPAGTTKPETPGEPAPARLEAVSPDGERLASMDADGRIRVAARDDPDGAATVIATRFRPADLASLRFSSDGRRVVCELRDGTTVEWDARTGARVATGGAEDRVVARRLRRRA